MKSNDIVKETDQHITPNCVSIEELLTGMANSGRYCHLQVILSKNDDRKMGRKYLMVTRNGFGIVKVVDLHYNDNQIYLVLQDTVSGLIKRIMIDIDDKEFKFILILWNDIRTMVLAKKENSFSHDDLLEFDY